jgi:signal transduction histidine kinase
LFYVLAQWESDSAVQVFALPMEAEGECLEASASNIPQAALSMFEQYAREIIDINLLRDSIQIQGRSVHCEPLIHANEILGLVYLENSYVSSGFPQSLRISLQHITKQIGVFCMREVLYVQLKNTIKLLQDTHEQLRYLSTIKELFLRSTSWDLKLPLQLILKLLASAKSGLTTKQLKDVEMIESSTLGLQSLLNDILDIKRDRFDVSMTSFELRSRLEDLVRLFSVNLRPDLGLLLNIEFLGGVHLNGDHLLLEHILHKLVLNAIKFTPRGKIILRVRAKESSLRGPENGVLLEFEIEDTGVGISDEQINLLFSAFSQAQSGTTRIYQGAGLGLSVAQKLLCSLAGSDARFAVQSQVGIGSKFSFVVPFQVATIDQSIPQEFNQLNGATVVVYTNNRFVFESYWLNLQGFGATLVQVKSFPQYVEQLQLFENTTEKLFCSIDIDSWDTSPQDEDFSKNLRALLCLSPHTLVVRKMNSQITQDQLFAIVYGVSGSNLVTRPFKYLSLATAMLNMLNNK